MRQRSAPFQSYSSLGFDLRQENKRAVQSALRTLMFINALYKHRGALRGTPGSACPQPEPNAAELPSCAPISARAAQRRRRRRWWRGDEGARRPGTEVQFLRHVLWHIHRNALRSALRRVLGVLVLHVSPKESVGSGGR